MSGPTRARDEFVINNELGLHFRAAAMVVRTVSGFSSTVTVSAGDVTADAKSVLELLTLQASKGIRVAVTAEGDDAQEAVAALGALIGRNFAE